jgi:threonine dehydratase
MSNHLLPVTFDMIVAASHRIRGQVQYTPLIQSARLTNILGTQISLKMENLQHTGAYKERGALNKLKCLNAAEREAGVFAASAGNHAQGLAYHAGRLGIKSTIFMPVGTPVIKVTRTKFYGADIVLTGVLGDCS